MIYIDVNLQNIIEAKEVHLNKLLPIVKGKRNACVDIRIKDFLTDEILTAILTNEPKKLYQLHLLFLRKIIGGDLNEFQVYLKVKKKRNRNTSQIALITKYENAYTVLEFIFNYASFSSKNNIEYSGYDLSNKLDIPTCPYCNRAYTKIVIKPSKITRPAFDHWYSKSDFPLLSLSFYNLIPSCNVCNSSLKGTDLFDLKTHFHPYCNLQKNKKLLDFNYSFEYENYSKFIFKINNHNIFSQKSTDAFKLKEIYETHEDEITDLRRLRDVYSIKYLEILKTKILKGTSTSDEEIYRLAFGTHIDETKFDRRPLSKMKKDILIELGIIKQNEK